ncbi:MAG: hypothetical protein JJ892_15210 [Balneola sp.]|nr:hypothetical protein [Balneola sp.]
MKRFRYYLLFGFLLSQMNSSVWAQSSNHLTFETDDWRYMKLSVFSSLEHSSLTSNDSQASDTFLSFYMNLTGIEIGTSTPFIDLMSLYYFEGSNPDFDLSKFSRDPFFEGTLIEAVRAFGISIEQGVFPILKEENAWKFFVNSSGTVGYSNYSGFQRRDIARHADVERFDQRNLEFSGNISAVADFALGKAKLRFHYAPITIRFGWGKRSYSLATFGASLLIKIK